MNKLNFNFPLSESDETLYKYLKEIIFCKIEFDKPRVPQYLKDYCFSKPPNQTQLGQPCTSPKFLSIMCRRSNIHLLKIVSLRLHLGLRLLDEFPDVDIRIIHLLRDPRGFYVSAQSTLTETFQNPQLYCSNAKRDLHVAQLIQTRHPYK